MSNTISNSQALKLFGTPAPAMRDEPGIKRFLDAVLDTGTSFEASRNDGMLSLETEQVSLSDHAVRVLRNGGSLKAADQSLYYSRGRGEQPEGLYVSSTYGGGESRIDLTA